jgi:hypothetical protein
MVISIDFYHRNESVTEERSIRGCTRRLGEPIGEDEPIRGK